MNTFFAVRRRSHLPTLFLHLGLSLLVIDNNIARDLQTRANLEYFRPARLEKPTLGRGLKSKPPPAAMSCSPAAGPLPGAHRQRDWSLRGARDGKSAANATCSLSDQVEKKIKRRDGTGISRQGCGGSSHEEACTSYAQPAPGKRRRLVSAHSTA
ncbi:hypothetical protein CKAH01_03619 [Colletotrichum kahawae]|uniref:Uncharacterized protein n=1 Tax=Colletotrichum kahawae TaxID=34407 RepID=A0AAD9YNR9_COLKA|nr:hypothetical protein CKAH01_03619 [Colletotrichum kahawae]